MPYLNLSPVRGPAPALAWWPCQSRLHRRAWLRLLLVATLFAAVHGLVGAWVVSALATPGQAVVEVCTPNGLQWVSLDGVADTEGPADGPQGLAQPCVWAASLTAQLPGGVQPVAMAWAHTVANPGLLSGWDAVLRQPGTAEQVLLMSPMRAPPG